MTAIVLAGFAWFSIAAQAENTTPEPISLNVLMDGCNCIANDTSEILITPCGDKETCDGKGCSKNGVAGTCVSDRHFIYNPETRAFELADDAPILAE